MSDAESSSAVRAGVPAPVGLRVALVRTGRTPGELAREFECSAQAIRNWVRQGDRDEGRREDGATTAEREDYEYRRCGSCNVFMATELLAGRRMTKVTARRTKTDWAHFLNDIAERHRDAKTITLVMDNLNTHRPGALYEAFPPAAAKALWDRFEFVYTPKHGSWLNVAEVELSVMIRQCLNRRITSLRVLRDEVAAWQASRDRIQAKVNWQFTTDDARVNLKRPYPTLDE